MHEMTIGRTRWGKFSMVSACAAVAIVALGIAIAKGLLAASFNVNNQAFELQSAGLQGNGFGAIMDDVDRHTPDGSTQGQAVARAGFQSANLNGLCAAVQQSVLGLPFTLKLEAGDPSNGAMDISANDLILDAESVNANATLTDLALGKSASDIALGSSTQNLGGTAGNFGLQAGTANLDGLKSKAYAATIAGTISLTNLSLGIESGRTNCPIVP